MSEPGTLIRYWRKYRGLSQLDLSLEANVSSKHISFLETGRAKPSREMLLLLSNTLDIPLNERNVLLSLAGYSEGYSRMQFDQPEMQSVNNALTLMLNGHEPYPAMVLDWNWNIIMANEPHKNLLKLMTDQQPNSPQTNNLLEMLFDPNGVRPFIENWEQVTYSLVQRIHRERLIHQDRQSSLLKKLMAFPDIPTHWQQHCGDGQIEPMISTVLVIGDIRLKLFGVLASFGAAIDITMQELIIEQHFPADEETKLYFERETASQ